MDQAMTRVRGEALAVAAGDCTSTPGPATQAARELGSASRSLCQLVLDQLSFGVLLLDDQAQVLLANQAAKRDLSQAQGLAVEGGRLQASTAAADQRLQRALAKACTGLRQLLVLEANASVPLLVIPLTSPGREPGQPLILVMLGRRQLCHPMVAEMFARSTGMTLAEARVLRSLAEGLAPRDIAKECDVALSTIRTQIGAVRGKIGAAGIVELLHELGRLPPGSPALIGCG